jgi:tetratricopeptide (TPR) repeat protein
VPPARDALALDQAVFFLHLGRARERLFSGRFDEARQELELARLVRPDDEELLNLVSLVEFRLGGYPEAAAATRALLEKNPDSAILHANLGLIQFKAGVFPEAESALARAVALKPDHARSHLYLGLLHRMRGELPSALDHLRRAGAKGAVEEIEEILRRRDPQEDPGAANALAPAMRVLAEEGRAAPPGERDAEDRPLFRVRSDGTLEIASRGCVYVRKGSVVWFSGRMSFAQEPAFARTRLEGLLRAEGRGELLLSDRNRRAVSRDTAGRSLYLEASHVLALSSAPRLRLEPILDFRAHRRVDILKVQGAGGVVFSVAGGLEAHDVAGDFPFCVSSRDLLAWTGDLLASVVEGGAFDEIMTPEAADAPKLRFEGEGVVLTETTKQL